MLIFMIWIQAVQVEDKEKLTIGSPLSLQYQNIMIILIINILVLLWLTIAQLQKVIVVRLLKIISQDIAPS